ncbi:uncharacterized protein LOC127157644 [Labeo rohita]|uniref:uncharacterized protein LOC127157644 n=1 Tax=Labeo rohita TaxID=84645 RepID=UPI0021E2D333|nr:uncharacterized protein LOC127157644 [Labeo rohita]
MELLVFIFVAVTSVISDGLIVRSPSGPLVAPLQSSVVLPCYVDKPLLMEGLEVEWRRTDSQTLVHLYEDGESRPESQQEDYHDRAHFFTDQIQHGNFSLRLDNLRAEDEGQYTCRVYSQQDSGETVVEIKADSVEHLQVSGSDESIFVSVGEDVSLNCSVDSHITPEHIEEVSWKKTDEDENILVLLYQNNKALPDSSDERYRDRVEFFTAEIPKGNFSLRLKSVRTEDKGVYMCHVFAGELSANATVVLEQLGFSISHIMVLILCIVASGSALLLCWLIYCRSHNEGTTLRLQVSLAICPNITLFFTFIFCGFTERFWNEIIICCALYILRPLMLLNAAPYLNDIQSIRRWIKHVSVDVEYAVFSIVFHTVIFVRIWGISLNYTAEDRNIVIGIFAVMLLMCSCILIKGLTTIREQNASENDQLCEKILSKLIGTADFFYYAVPSMQFVLLCYGFGASRNASLILGPLIMVTVFRWNYVCETKCMCKPIIWRTIWLLYMFVSSLVMVYFYLTTMKSEKDYVGWACTAGFLHLLWAMTYFPYILDDMDYPRKISVYLFGSVGVVLVISVVMMTELILKTVNGKRKVGDLRNIVFPSESVFVLLAMTAQFFKFYKTERRSEPAAQNTAEAHETLMGPNSGISDMTCSQCCQEAARSNDLPATRSNENQDSQNAEGLKETPTNRSNLNQKTEESCEMNPLLKTENQEAGRSDATEIDPLVSQI